MDIKRRIAEFKLKYKELFYGEQTNEQIHKAMDETTQSRSSA